MSDKARLMIEMTKAVMSGGRIVIIMTTDQRYTLGDVRTALQAT